MPHVFCCRILGVAVSWFYKWLGRAETPMVQTDTVGAARELDAAVRRRSTPRAAPWFAAHPR